MSFIRRDVLGRKMPVLDVDVDKSLYGGLSIRSERLGESLPATISFQVKTSIPALNVTSETGTELMLHISFTAYPGKWTWIN